MKAGRRYLKKIGNDDIGFYLNTKIIKAFSQINRYFRR